LEGKPASRSQRFESAFELIAARQCENRIDSVVREAACRLRNILVPRVDC
jgi:hypothetical protein